jgi:hypothetical protein
MSESYSQKKNFTISIKMMPATKHIPDVNNETTPIGTDAMEWNEMHWKILPLIRKE